MDHRPDTAQDTPPAEQAIILRDKAPELYDLWLKIAQEKAATSNYVQRAPYEVPERLAQSGRPRALSAMIVVLAFCGYLASLGGPGPYIGGLIAILDLLVMLALFFGLRPDHLTDSSRPRKRRLIRAIQPRRSGPGGPATATQAGRPMAGRPMAGRPMAGRPRPGDPGRATQAGRPRPGDPGRATQPRVPGRTEPPGAGRTQGAQQLPPDQRPADLPDQHHRLVCGLASTGLVSVPPYLATLGVPYCASPPKSVMVRPRMTSPKFHEQPSWWLRLSDQKA
jgi:hypothetical protein